MGPVSQQTRQAFSLRKRCLLHFLPEGGDICSVPTDAFIGPCTVVEVPEGMITGAFIEEYFPRNAKRILIKSHGKAYLHESAASELSYLGYILVGNRVPPYGYESQSRRRR